VYLNTGTTATGALFCKSGTLQGIIEVDGVVFNTSTTATLTFKLQGYVPGTLGMYFWGNFNAFRVA
jgi:hypothetical protein